MELILGIAAAKRDECPPGLLRCLFQASDGVVGEAGQSSSQLRTLIQVNSRRRCRITRYSKHRAGPCSMLCDEALLVIAEEGGEALGATSRAMRC